MSYAGNPSLAPDVRERILETFRHTLDGAARGSVEEARLGCDFILRLDPLFTPAQLLADRLRGASGPVSVGDLRERADNGPGLVMEPMPELAGADLLSGFGSSVPAPSTPVRGGAGLRAELAGLVAARDFTTLMRRAGEEQATVAADPGLQQLLSQAAELMEAAPYVTKFIEKARAALDAGRPEEAQAMAEKARALDPSHPGLAALFAAPAPQASPAPPPAMEAFAVPTPRAGGGGPGTSFGADLPLDLPPLGELPDLDLSAGDALSIEGLGGDALRGSPGGAADADPRIAELLAEGETLFGRGELQAAIDAWSRIFLIDIDHQEAARRIDSARNAKAEQERLIEETYHEALAQAQTGSVEAAKAGLARVLELQPHHLAAREALDKLERGEVDLPRPKAGSGLLGLDDGPGGGDAVLQEEILVPPEPGERPRSAAVAAKPESKRTLMLAAAGVVVVLGLAGWFLATRWSSLFPNAEEQPAPITAPQQTPITRATQLATEGKRAVAIAQLKRVPPPSPYYEEAQALIAQWEAEEAAANAPQGPSPELLALRASLLEQARGAGTSRRFLAVGPLLDQAAAIAPLTADEQVLRNQALQSLESLKAPLELIRGEEYALALRPLWTELEKDAGNSDARHLLAVSYYNLGVVGLQGGRLDEAETNLAEAATLSPGDPEVQRLIDLAHAYRSRQQDLLYRIYVKYLAKREV